MRTKPRDLGTRLETFVVRVAQARGLIAERLPEGAVNDRGDVRILTDREWVGEVKDRMALNVPRELDKTIRKAGSPFSFVVWRKMVRLNGSTRRSQDGPIIVAVTLDTFLGLLMESVGERLEAEEGTE